MKYPTRTVAMMKANPPTDAPTIRPRFDFPLLSLEFAPEGLFVPSDGRGSLA